MYFQSLSSKYGNYSESEFWELRKDLWSNRSDEYKLKCSEDGKRWWDERSDKYKLKWSEDKLKWWDEWSVKYKLEWSEDGKRRWDDQSDKEYKLKWSEDGKQRTHDLRKISSGSTEEATYYAIDGANEDGTYILITEIFGTNDLNFSKKVRRRNGKMVMMKFHTMETIDELHLRKCSIVPKHAHVRSGALT
jgi:hypothetical protein